MLGLGLTLFFRNTQPKFQSELDAPWKGKQNTPKKRSSWARFD